MSQALDELFFSHRKTLLWRLLRMVRCRHTAEDLVQETYLRVARALEQRPVEHLQPFLYQTAHNVALDHLRHEQVKRRVEAEEPDSSAVLNVPTNAASPEATLIDRQKLALFDRVMRDLPERTRQMLVLNRLHGWSYPEIAAHLGVSQSTVYNNIRLALARCLAELDRDAG